MLEFTNLVVVGIDCIDSYNSNYHAITATTIIMRKELELQMEHVINLFNKGNNKITELRTIFLRESQNS